MNTIRISLLYLLFLFIGIQQGNAQGNKVLVIRGGSGTGGFFGGGFDSQLSDLFDFNTFSGNTAWGEYGTLISGLGFVPEQMIEGDASNNTPVDLVNIDLTQYALIIFGSNNAEYPIDAIDNVENYIRNGGSALFISDANWGSYWGDAPDSDQQFMSRFGWVMNQDNGTYVIESDDFLVPDHPIFAGVSAFDGEGVSPITVGSAPGVSSVILANAEGQVRRNTSMDSGPLSPAQSDDAALVVAQVGQGRIGGHFDRNTFFNLNGVGSSLHQYDNRTYAENLIIWLTSTSSCSFPSGTPCDDGDPCTIDDAYDDNCNCTGTPQDIDMDGICDEDDNCPSIFNTNQSDFDQDGIGDACDPCSILPGTPCDDTDPCTLNDVYDNDCNCAGTFVDTDQDLICDALDNCPDIPNTSQVDIDDDGIGDVCDPCSIFPGTPCDDLDPCTINDMYDDNCNCAGTFQDTDQDLICDGLDNCPDIPNTSQVDVDTDGIGDACDPCSIIPGTPCDDASSCTTNDMYDDNCNCVGTFQDADQDGFCDAEDNCPNTANPDQADADNDGLGDVCDDCSILVGTACNDGDTCTINDVYDDDCNCAGTFQDADQDGVCDEADNCPNSANPDQADADNDGLGDVCDDCSILIGTACNDGDTCTINDVYDDNCNCAGTFQDADLDGVCDAEDNCPNSANPDQADADNDGLGDVCDDCSILVGTACNDGDTCTINDVYDDNCNCAGTFQDADLDGLCDAEDNCPNSANPDQADADNDGLGDVCDDCSILIGTACNDGDTCTINDVYDDNCNCAGTFQDADQDGVCDEADNCPNSANPDQADADNDGLGDVCDDCSILIGTVCNDGDTCTINDVYDDDCNCSGTYQDADLDGVCDVEDNCPNSANPDQADADNDGLGDVCDDCSILVGTACNDGDTCTINDVYDDDCNCSGTYQDADLDGVCDVEDNCPNSANPDQADYDGDQIGDSCDKLIDPTCPLAGQACDDGKSGTKNDVFDKDCQCIGSLVPNQGDNNIPNISLSKKVSKEVRVYPNPAKHTLFVYFPRENIELESVAHLQIYNVFGQVMKVLNLEYGQPETLELDISNLPVGVYFLKVQVGKTQWNGLFEKME